MYIKYCYLHNAVMYSNHMYLVIDTLFERLMTNNALEFRIHSTFILQVSSYTAFVLILTTTSIRAMNIFFTLNRKCTYNNITNKNACLSTIILH